jgi:nucleoside 2-deoxyribosyltransferase
MSKVYLAGPMSGYDANNFPAFDRARDRLKALGHEVLSPADLSRAAGVSDDGTVVPDGMGYSEFMRQDIDAVFEADMLFMLQGWERSRGAKVEHALADLLGKRIVYESDAL